MNKTKNIFYAVVIGLSIHLLIACSDHSQSTEMKTEEKTPATKSNPVVYFEIPVSDIDRAIAFYKAVFQFDFDKERIDNNEMALFPFEDSSSGISGALAKGEIYKPTIDGVLIYFKTDNIDETLKMATQHGGQILYPKSDNGIGLVAEFQDPEGNRIALYQSK